MMKKLLNWFRLANLETDLDRELKYHLDRRVSDLVRSGLPEPEARRQATLELGGVSQVQEEVRDVWLNRWLAGLRVRRAPVRAVPSQESFFYRRDLQLQERFFESVLCRAAIT